MAITKTSYLFIRAGCEVGFNKLTERPDVVEGRNDPLLKRKAVQISAFDFQRKAACEVKVVAVTVKYRNLHLLEGVLDKISFVVIHICEEGCSCGEGCSQPDR